MTVPPSTLPPRIARGPATLIATLLVIGALAAIVIVSTRAAADSTSGTFDESIYLDAGRRLLISGDYKGLAELGIAPLPVRLAWTRAALDPIAAESMDPSVYRERIRRARRNAAWLFGVPLVLAVFTWAAIRSGVAAGAVAGALVALSPNIVAHASLATTDVAATVGVVLALGALVWYLEARSLARGAVFAFTLGVAIAAKYSALTLVPVTIIACAWHRRGRAWIGDLCALAAAVFVVWALHDWMVAPLGVEGGRAAALVPLFSSVQGPMFLRGMATQFYLERNSQEAFLLGATTIGGWWYYMPVALAMKSTPVELMVFLAFAWSCFGRGARTVDGRVRTTAAVVFSAGLMMMSRDLGIRYALPLVALGIIGGVIWISEALARHRLLLAGVAVAAVLGQAWSTGSIAPQQLAYFNDLSGGPALGYSRLVDSNVDWGQDLPRLSDWLHQQRTNRVALAYFGTAPPGAYGLSAVSVRQMAALPREQQPAFLAISVTYLQGVNLCTDPFAGFRALQPTAPIGYSLMVYALNREDVKGPLSAAQSNSCAP